MATLVSEEVAASLERLTDAGTSASDSLGLESWSVLELLLAVERGVDGPQLTQRLQERLLPWLLSQKMIEMQINHA